MRSWLTAICIVVLGPVSTIACGPTQPTRPEMVRLTSVRYVRTRPAVGAETFVGLQYSIPRPDDPYRRPSMGAVGLRSVDGVTFVYDYPETFNVPVGHTSSLYISDAAVSPYSVATDIYVNDTKIRVEKAGNYEYGRFRVDETGNVY